MEFPWGADGLKAGISSSDAELLARWPGLLFENSRDYLMWGVWCALRDLPADRSRSGKRPCSPSPQKSPIAGIPILAR
jgi:hypothetical protein